MQLQPFFRIYRESDTHSHRYTLPSDAPYFLLLVTVRKGKVSLVADGNKLPLEQGQLTVVLLRSFYSLSGSAHVKYVLALLSYDSSSVTAGFLMVLSDAPRVVGLRPEESDILWNMVNMLAVRDTVTPREYGALFISKGMELLLGYIDYLYDRNRVSVLAGNCTQELARGFLQLAIKWCRIHHRMRFYADSLFVTPAHLNKAVKHTLGLSAKQCLAKFLLAEAKQLLQDRRNTMASVSDTLNFSDPAVFSRFFLRHSGMTPGYYQRHYGCR